MKHYHLLQIAALVLFSNICLGGEPDTTIHLPKFFVSPSLILGNPSISSLDITSYSAIRPNLFRNNQVAIVSLLKKDIASFRAGFSSYNYSVNIGFAQTCQYMDFVDSIASNAMGYNNIGGHIELYSYRYHFGAKGLVRLDRLSYGYAGLNYAITKYPSSKAVVNRFSQGISSSLSLSSTYSTTYVMQPELGLRFYTNRTRLSSLSLGISFNYESSFPFIFTERGRNIWKSEYQVVIDNKVAVKHTFTNSNNDGLGLVLFRYNHYFDIPAKTTKKSAPVIGPGLSIKKYSPINLTILLDVSGSMSGTKIEMVKQGMSHLIDSLRIVDHFSLLTFNEKTKVISSDISVAQDAKNDLKKEIDKLEATGSTHGTLGLKTAYKHAKKAYLDPAENYVLIITDGGFNDPKYSDETLWNLIVDNYLGNNIHLSIIGIKNNASTQLRMANLADGGNGKYLSVEEIEDLEFLLLNEVKNITWLR